MQKKVIIMYELSANLARLLEVVALSGPALFLEPDSSAAHLNLDRAMETIVSIFDRTLLFPERKTFQLILSRQNLYGEIGGPTMSHPSMGVVLALYAALHGR